MELNYSFVSANFFCDITDISQCSILFSTFMHHRVEFEFFQGEIVFHSLQTFEVATERERQFSGGALHIIEFDTNRILLILIFNLIFGNKVFLCL